MRIEPLPLDGTFLINTLATADQRGSFLKVFHKNTFDELGIQFDFQEMYYSISKKNVIRGMHFQVPPSDHDKLVYVTEGEILDVVLDLRRSSPTFGQSHAVVLQQLGRSIFIPRGFAHGFLTLSESATVVYNVSSVYDPQSDKGILWSSIDFNWPVETPILSERDRNFVDFANFNSPF